jgi:hypothetical protein
VLYNCEQTKNDELLMMYASYSSYTISYLQPIVTVTIHQQSKKPIEALREFCGKNRLGLIAMMQSLEAKELRLQCDNVFYTPITLDGLQLLSLGHHLFF